MNNNRDIKIDKQISHFITRAKERYNLELTKEDVLRISYKIQIGKSVPIVKKSNRISLQEVKYKDVWIRVAYDSRSHLVVTALEPNME